MFRERRNCFKKKGPRNIIEIRRHDGVLSSPALQFTWCQQIASHIYFEEEIEQGGSIRHLTIFATKKAVTILLLSLLNSSAEDTATFHHGRFDVSSRHQHTHINHVTTETDVGDTFLAVLTLKIFTYFTRRGHSSGHEPSHSTSEGILFGSPVPRLFNNTIGVQATSLQSNKAKNTVETECRQVTSCSRLDFTKDGE
jgi:hypothetical protein